MLRPAQLAIYLSILIGGIAIAVRLIAINQPFIDQLELAAKRRRRDRAKFLRERFSFCLSANRLGGGPARLRRNGIPDSAVHRRALLQSGWRARVGWTRPGRHFIRRVTAFFLFARARNFRRDRSDLGFIFLQLRAAQRDDEPLFHARHAVARVSQSSASIFFCAGSTIPQDRHLSLPALRSSHCRS